MPDMAGAVAAATFGLKSCWKHERRFLCCGGVMAQSDAISPFQIAQTTTITQVSQRHSEIARRFRRRMLKRKLWAEFGHP
jgi:hypothetical protein